MADQGPIQPDLISGLERNSGRYFLSASISGVRTFAGEQRLDFTIGGDRVSRWTILLGDNGVGKTTILQCLALVAEEFPRMSPREHWVRDVEQIRALRRSSSLNSKIKIEIGSTDKFRVFDRETIEISVAPSESCVLTQGGDPRVELYAFGALRRVGTVSLSETSKSHPTSTLFDDNVPLLNAEEWILQTDYAATKSDDAVAARRLEQVKSVLVRLLPDVDELRVVANGPNPPSVEAKMPYGWVPMRSLSSGYRSVVAWMIDLANRMFLRHPKSKDPLAEPVIVLVDQIDMFLHPKWQRDLVKNLSSVFPRAQFIVTAHSPLIVQGMPDANIALLRREGDYVVIDQSVKSIRGWRADQVLASDLFDNVGTRDPETEALLEERKRLLTKAKLSADEEKRAKELERILDDLPVGESKEEMEAMAILQRAAKRLEAAK
jgi:predicted ATPase